MLLGFPRVASPQRFYLAPRRRFFHCPNPLHFLYAVIKDGLPFGHLVSAGSGPCCSAFARRRRATAPTTRPCTTLIWCSGSATSFSKCSMYRECSTTRSGCAAAAAATDPSGAFSKFSDGCRTFSDPNSENPCRRLLGTSSEAGAGPHGHVPSLSSTECSRTPSSAKWRSRRRRGTSVR